MLSQSSLRSPSSGGLRPALTIFPKSPYWEFVSNIVKHRNGLDPATERAIFRGAVGEAAAVEFSAFLNVYPTRGRS